MIEIAIPMPDIERKANEYARSRWSAREFCGRYGVAHETVGFVGDTAQGAFYPYTWETPEEAEYAMDEYFAHAPRLAGYSLKPIEGLPFEST
jgi:hypothetical protein